MLYQSRYIIPSPTFQTKANHQKTWHIMHMLTPNLNNSSCEPRQPGPSSEEKQALWGHALVQEWYSNVERFDFKKHVVHRSEKDTGKHLERFEMFTSIEQTRMRKKKTFKMKLHEACKMKLHEACLRLSQLSKVNLLSLKECASRCQDVRNVGEAEFTACQSAARMLRRNPCTPCRRSTR